MNCKLFIWLVSLLLWNQVLWLLTKSKITQKGHIRTMNRKRSCYVNFLHMIGITPWACLLRMTVHKSCKGIASAFLLLSCFANYFLVIIHRFQVFISVSAKFKAIDCTSIFCDTCCRPKENLCLSEIHNSTINCSGVQVLCMATMAWALKMNKPKNIGISWLKTVKP